MSLTVTPLAAKHIESLLKDQNATDKALRLFVHAGGCSGLEYGMNVDSQNPDDVLVVAHGARVVVDPKSLKSLDGSVIDFIEGLQGTGFKITNPNAKETCGCGKSFG